MIAVNPPPSHSPSDRIFPLHSSSPNAASPRMATHSPPTVGGQHPISYPPSPAPFATDDEEDEGSEHAPVSSPTDRLGVNQDAPDTGDISKTPTNGTFKPSNPSQAQQLTIQTNDAYLGGVNEEDAPQSVIHAPAGFGDFRTVNSPSNSTASSTDKSDVTIKSPLRIRSNLPVKYTAISPVSPPPLTTEIEPEKKEEEWSERATPRAQTRQEAESLEKKAHRRSLPDIPENLGAESAQEETEDELETLEAPTANLRDYKEEMSALKTALSECWTLCNTLASLSSIHRERLFNVGGQGDTQEQAWKSCWKLCQNLYDHRDSDHASQVRPTLDLCREFCQALFEVRVKDNEISDSILRVSFELNNHLYNTHDRNLPEAFRERTLDFYITLCHRLMKQRTRLAEETDSLLRACWSLAEMLFSLRQSKREGKLADEELLGSAVQACWELCDLFREGWTQIRPDRGTPRASQTTFTEAFYQAKRAEIPNAEEPTPSVYAPETPTTVFDDTATVAPDQAPVPNILVLGPGNTQTLHAQWSSNASTLSGYSQSSENTSSSTHTIKSPAEDPNLTCLKLLILRAAMNSGFQRESGQTLPAFVKALSSDAFGTSPWQTSLLANYKNLVTVDPAFRAIAPPGRATAPDVSGAVQVMIQHSGRYTWLRELYRLVFGFRTEEAVHRATLSIQT